MSFIKTHKSNLFFARLAPKTPIRRRKRKSRERIKKKRKNSAFFFFFSDSEKWVPRSLSWWSDERQSQPRRKHCVIFSKTAARSSPVQTTVLLIEKTGWLALIQRKSTYNQIVWPGTHDSATNKIGFPFVSRPFAQCHQLVKGTRVLDIRIQEDRKVCHGILATYSVDVVIKDIKKFLSETESEIIILEIRTEFGHQDPPEFEKYLGDQLGEFLVHHDDHVFGKTIAELLPKRIICIWKPRKSPQPKAGGPLWSAGYLKDNWIDTDLPSTKFESNMKHLSEQQPVTSRKYFYRVENTVTPKADNPVLCVKPVTRRIHGYARLFITQCSSRGCADRLQIFSTDFIDEDFVDACVGLTQARVEGKA